MITETTLYSKIGMALISAQRVEFITSQLLEHLKEFDDSVYGITSIEFLSNSKKTQKTNRTLGAIFKELKLNPKLVIDDVLDNYLSIRNLLVHGFWKNYLTSKSQEQMEVATTFCNEFGKLSNDIILFDSQCNSSSEEGKLSNVVS